MDTTGTAVICNQAREQLVSRFHTVFRYFWFFLCVTPVLINFPFGFGENVDSYFVFNKSTQFANNGYVKSRSWGVPLYELTIYPLVSGLGVGIGKLYSLIWVVLSQLFVFFLLKNLNSIKAMEYLGVLAFSLMPCTIISGNTLLETSQGVAFALGTLFFAQKFFLKENRTDLLLSFFSAVIASATRPDYFILIIALTASLLIFNYPKRLLIVCLSIVSTLTFLLPYFLLYKDFPLTSLNVLNTGDPIWMRFCKTFIGYGAVLGLPAIILLGYFFLGFIRNRIVRDMIKQKFQFYLKIKTDPFILFFYICSLLYLTRMVLLPDEIEYIYFWAVFLLIIVFARMRSLSDGYLFAVAIALPNVTQIHFFDRREKDSSVTLSFGLSPGIIQQERQRRLLNEFIRTTYPAIAQKEIDHSDCKGFHLFPYDIFNEQFPEATNQSCVVSSIKWYVRMRDFVLPSLGGSMERMFKWYKRGIIIHHLPTDRGWRRFLKFEESYPLRPEFEQLRIRPAFSTKEDPCFWEGRACASDPG